MRRWRPLWPDWLRPIQLLWHALEPCTSYMKLLRKRHRRASSGLKVKDWPQQHEQHLRRRFYKIPWSQNLLSHLDSSCPWERDPRPRASPSTWHLVFSLSQGCSTRDLFYLSLLNYSDLLVATQQQSDSIGCGILDTGVVKQLPLVGWDVYFNQELALVSLCDASDLDGSDPVLWLKLACAARRLSITSGDKSLRYIRLERHALEMGKRSLPPFSPPRNRSIIQNILESRSSNPSDVLKWSVTSWIRNNIVKRVTYAMHFTHVICRGTGRTEIDVVTHSILPLQLLRKHVA